jgi:hypothetical protein
MRDGYDSAIGRYSQFDPLGLSDGTNAYVYVRSSPVIYVDPTGEFVFAIPAGICAADALMTLLVGGTAVVSAHQMTTNAAEYRPPQTSSGGGNCCPPDSCQRALEALRSAYEHLRKLVLSPKELTSVRRYETLGDRRKFNKLVDEYNKACAAITRPFEHKLDVGPRRPTIPGGQLLQEYYTK